MSTAVQKSNFDNIKSLINGNAFNEKVKAFLGESAPAFLSNALSVINSSKALKNAQPDTVYSAVLVSATLKLSLDKNLSQAYIIPYENKRTGITEAQFQIGWRGLIRLALRSPKIKKINVTDVRESELTKRDRLTGDIVFNWENNDKVRSTQNIIGYVSYIELDTGFSKPLYMTVEEILQHGQKYSKTFSKGDSKWQTEFDSMARKTVLKKILLDYAPFENSSELAQSIKLDQSVIKGDNEITYPDNPEFTDIEDVTSNSQEANAMGELKVKLNS